eukprot:ANDGO_00946.mRNA.1 hypothetical protein
MRYLLWVKVSQYLLILSMLIFIGVLIVDQWSYEYPWSFDRQTQTYSVPSIEDCNYYRNVGLRVAQKEFCNPETETSQEGDSDICADEELIVDYFYSYTHEYIKSGFQHGQGDYDEWLNAWRSFREGTYACLVLAGCAFGFQLITVVIIIVLTWSKEPRLTFKSFLGILFAGTMQLILLFIPSVTYPFLRPRGQFHVVTNDGQHVTYDYHNAFNSFALCGKLTLLSLSLSTISWVIMIAFLRKLRKVHVTKKAEEQNQLMSSASEELRDQARGAWINVFSSAIVAASPGVPSYMYTEMEEYGDEPESEDMLPLRRSNSDAAENDTL